IHNRAADGHQDIASQFRAAGRTGMRRIQQVKPKCQGAIATQRAGLHWKSTPQWSAHLGGIRQQTLLPSTRAVGPQWPPPNARALRHADAARPPNRDAPFPAQSALPAILLGQSRQGLPAVADVVVFLVEHGLAFREQPPVVQPRQNPISSNGLRYGPATP